MIIRPNEAAVVYHGDFKHVLGHVAANLIVTSPPYNIGSKAERKDGFRRR